MASCRCVLTTPLTSVVWTYTVGSLNSYPWLCPDCTVETSPKAMRFYPQFGQPLGDLWPIWGKQNSNKNLYFIIYGAFLPACWGSFEVMLFLLWEFFHRDLCLHVWFAEGISSLNSPFSSCPPLGSSITRMSGKGTGTWDWLWFLDLLAEWLLLSPQASQSSHLYKGNNNTVHLKWELLCTASSLQLYVLHPRILPLRVANIWKTIWTEHVRVCQLSAQHLQFSLYWNLPDVI